LFLKFGASLLLVTKSKSRSIW